MNKGLNLVFSPTKNTSIKRQCKHVATQLYRWHRIDREVIYKRVIRKGKYFIIPQYQKFKVLYIGRLFYTVEFDYEFEYDNDIVWFATSIPYTYSMLLKYIKSIEDNVINPNKEDEDNKRARPKTNVKNRTTKKFTQTNKICEIKSLGKSLGGLNIPLIEITDYN